MAAAADDTGAAHRGITWPQTGALLLGGVYLLVGIVGFFWTGGSHFADPRGNDMIIGLFMVDPLHNVVHVLVGLAGLVLARTPAGARTYGWVLFVGYATVSVYGFIAAGRSWDVLALNSADNGLHVVTAFLGLALALAPVPDTGARRSVPASG